MRRMTFSILWESFIGRKLFFERIRNNVVFLKKGKFPASLWWLQLASVVCVGATSIFSVAAIMGPGPIVGPRSKALRIYHLFISFILYSLSTATWYKKSSYEEISTTYNKKMFKIKISYKYITWNSLQAKIISVLSVKLKYCPQQIKLGKSFFIGDNL